MKNTATATTAPRMTWTRSLMASTGAGTVHAPWRVVNSLNASISTRGNTRGSTLTFMDRVSPMNRPSTSQSFSLSRSMTWSMDQKEPSRKRTRKGSGR